MTTPRQSKQIARGIPEKTQRAVLNARNPIIDLAEQLASAEVDVEAQVTVGESTGSIKHLISP